MFEKSGISKAVVFGAVALAAFGLTLSALYQTWLDEATGRVAYLLLASLLLSFVMIFSSLRGEIRMAVPFSLAFLVLGGVMAMVSVALSPEPGIAFLHAASLPGHFILFIALLAAASDRDFGKILLKCLLGAGVILAGFSIVDFLGTGPADRAGSTHFRHGVPLFCLLLTLTLGLLFNSIHERMDRSVLSRRILYSVSILILAVALFYTGNPLVWIAFGLGLLIFFIHTGGEYILRNSRALLLTAALVSGLVGFAVIMLALADPPFAEYGNFGAAMAKETAGWSAVGPELLSNPLAGRAFEPLPAAEFPRSAYLLIAREGGLPVGILFMLFFFITVIRLRPVARTGPAHYEMPIVRVGPRRAIPAIELTLAAMAGGVAAFLLLNPLELPPPATNRIFLAVIFLPLWILYLSLSYSYKHFTLTVYNRRDFVTIGLTAGATAVALYSIGSDALLDPQTAAPVVACLAIACARSGQDLGQEHIIDLRARPASRILLGFSSVIAAISTGALLAMVWKLGASILA